MGQDDFRNRILHHLPSLHRFAFALLRDRHDAEELVQETILRAIEGAHTWQQERDLRRWLFAIMHNVFVSNMRKHTVRSRFAAEEASMENHSVAPPQIPEVELAQTMRALYELPEEQREALLLVSVEGLSYREAAGILDIPIGTLMSRLARGRGALRNAISRPEEHRLRVVK